MRNFGEMAYNGGDNRNFATGETGINHDFELNIQRSPHTFNSEETEGAKFGWTTARREAVIRLLSDPKGKDLLSSDFIYLHFRLNSLFILSCSILRKANPQSFKKLIFGWISIWLPYNILNEISS